MNEALKKAVEANKRRKENKEVSLEEISNDQNNRSSLISTSVIDEFAELFKGRDDARGIVDEKIVLDHYKSHIMGIESLGVYPVYNEKYCRFAVVDFDFHNDKDREKKARHHALRFKKKLNDIGLKPSFFEISRSGLIHLWLFFNNELEAKKIRFILNSIAEELKIEIRGGVVEIFPKQDTVTSQDGVGNYINLPYFDHKSDSKRRKIIDFKNHSKPMSLASFIRIAMNNRIGVQLINKLYSKLRNERTLELTKKKKTKPSRTKSNNLTFQEQIIEILSPCWTEGQRQELALYISGYLAKAGVTVEASTEILTTVADINGDEEIESRIKALEATYRKINKGNIEDIAGHSKTKNILKDDTDKLQKVVDKLVRSLNINPLCISDIANYKINDEDFINRHLSLMKNSATLISGDPGVGKTWLILEIARAAVKGEKLFGKYDTRKSKVVYFDQESPKQVIYERINKMQFPKQGCDFYIQEGLSIERDDDIIKQKCMDADLVIFDSLIQFHSKDEISPREMNKTIKQFTKLAGECSCSVILIHQNRKESSKGYFKGHN